MSKIFRRFSDCDSRRTQGLLVCVSTVQRKYFVGFVSSTDNKTVRGRPGDQRSFGNKLDKSRGIDKKRQITQVLFIVLLFALYSE